MLSLIHEPAHHAARLADGRLLPRGLGPGQNRRLLRTSACGSIGAPALVEPRLPAGVLRHAGRFRHSARPRDRSQDPLRARRRAQTRPHPAGRPHGHVPLGRLLPQGVERRLRPRLRLQHGRVERRAGQHAAARQSRRLPVRDGSGLLRPAGQADRADHAAHLRNARTSCRAIRRRSPSFAPAARSWSSSSASAASATSPSGSRTSPPSSPATPSGRRRRTGSAPSCTR